jgi:hypothetical protein
MKGIVLVLLCLVVAVRPSTAAGGDMEFGVTNNSSSPGADPALMLRTYSPHGDLAARLVSDDRSEVRGARPSVAYTVFQINARFAHVSLQPVLGRINGAQVHLDF